MGREGPSDKETWRRNVPQPWHCGMRFGHPDGPFGCGEPIVSIGRDSRDGNVHHIDEDPWNNSWDNLLLVHAICHQQYHHNGAKPSSRFTGHKHTEETKARMREAALQRPPKSEETRRKQAESLRGFRHSDETKAKWSVQRRGKPKSAETRAKMAAAARRRWARERGEL